MTLTLKAISSMATRQVLLEVAAAFEAQSGYRIEFESVGGVDAAKRVQAGEAFDVVVLASDAIDKLIAAGHVLPAAVWTWCVRAWWWPCARARPCRHRQRSRGARGRAGASSISYSTGPSGVALAALFERWGIADQIKPRMVQAPPACRWAALVAKRRGGAGLPAAAAS
jgi:molybdate transport system substrate-binding protein